MNRQLLLANPLRPKLMSILISFVLGKVITKQNNIYISVFVLVYLLFDSQVDGYLYELDGRKSFPVNHGPSSPETILSGACKVIKDFMARDPDEVRFTIIAFSKFAA